MPQSQNPVGWKGLAVFGPGLRFALVAFIVVGLRMPTLRQVVIDWDESVYLVVAHNLAEGGKLYDSVWDHKGPFLYAALYPVVWLADGNIEPIRWFASGCVLLTMLFVDLTARRIVGPSCSFLAALVYGLVFSLPRFGGLAANAELFMMLPGTAALWLFVKRRSGQNRHAPMALCGLLATAAILVKSTALFTVAVIPFVLFIEAVRGPARRRQEALIDLGTASGAAATLVGVVLFWFVHQGTLARYIFATIEFNRMYVTGVSLGESWQQFAAFFAWAAVGDIFTALAILGVIFLLARLNEVEPEVTIFLFGLSVLSLLGVIAARNLFFHYYLQMALPIALIVTIFVATLRIDPTDWRRMTSIALLLGVASAWSPHRFEREALTRNPDEDRVLVQVADFIKGNGRDDDTLFVLGGEPILYFLSGRTSPSEYFFWLYATDRWDSILGSKESLLRTFELHPPDWFVYAPHDLRVPELEDFMYENYVLVHRIGDYEIAVRANR